MAVSPLAAAKHLAQLSDWEKTNLEIQKLLYLGHMVSLGRHDSGLVKGTFEAWDYGPVLPPVYHRLKVFGRAPVQDIFSGVKDISETRSGRILDDVYEAFGHMSPGRLVRITHRKGGAWDRHYDPDFYGIEIPDGDIKREYRDLIDDD